MCACQVLLVCHIIDQVGFKSELGRIESQKSPDASTATATARPPAPTGIDLLVGIVQDADRLDAIGAIGIARCFTFGGYKKRPLYDPSQPPRHDLTMAQYQSGTSTPSINHFYEKLLRLKELMKTDAGRRRAEKRHKLMVEYLQAFQDECEGRA